VRVFAALFGVCFLVIGFVSVRRGFGSDQPATREAVVFASAGWLLLVTVCFVIAAVGARAKTLVLVLFGCVFALFFVGVGRLLLRVLRSRS
jgi:hypothetical protein